ncbi:hypothetical protein [Immundisolibacter sp.]|uniref:hypothetical protein n=1 Tax=Immundisolibacter sp. TaxID=1934948 RepID=UPI00260DB658|nr:hypothetical protein [Immundisolibacter sp.]MDD3652215.1 hypothetical protein [Immundisolibacter sp.]
MKRLLGCLLVCLLTAAAAGEDDFDRRCGPFQAQRLAPSADTGVVIVDALLRAYAPVEITLDYGVAVLRGIGKGLGVHSSAYSCTDFMVIAGLRPGRYRLSALEARISSVTLPQRFLYPMPNDGYQIVNPHDWREGPQLYRVQPPRTPELQVEVSAGEVSYLGVEVVHTRFSAHAVTVRRRADAAREQLARERLQRLIGAPATDASAPAARPPAAATP